MTHTSTEQERQAPIKMHPGDDLHLTVLMASHGLNFVTGKDREQLLAWGRDVWQAARRAPVAPHPPSDAPQGWTPISERLPDFMEFCDWLMPMTDAKRERWILANESMATASVPGLATHWRKAYALPELMAAEPRQKKSNSPEFDGIKTVPQAQEKQ